MYFIELVDWRAQGGLLNYADVVEGLNSGHLAGVGTDVYCVEPYPTPKQITTSQKDNISSSSGSKTIPSGSSQSTDKVSPDSAVNLNTISSSKQSTGGVNSNTTSNKNQTKRVPFTDHHAFLFHPHVICTPHIAGVTEISYQIMAKQLADNVIRLRNGQEPIGLVNKIDINH